MRPRVWEWYRKLDELGETEGAYKAFLFYLELGVPRTLERLLEYYKNKGYSRGTPTIKKLEDWETRYNWHVRASNYDREVTREENEERRKIAREKQWNLAMKMFDKAEQIISLPVVQKTVLDEGRTTILKPVKCSIDSAPRLSSQASFLADQVTKGDQQEGLDILAAIEVLHRNDLLPSEISNRLAALFASVPEESRVLIESMFKDKTLNIEEG